MEKRKRLGLILVLAFVIVTGILFSADFAAGPDPQSVPEISSESSDTEEVPGKGRADETGETDNVQPETGDSGAESSQKNGSGSDIQEASGVLQEEQIYVYVCGAVKHPDVYCLRSGARVFEALEKAGGVTKDAQPQLMNLAAALSDGERIYVPREGEDDPAAAGGGQMGASAMAGSSGDAQSGGSNGLIDINRASKEQLMTLPGIGSSRAEDILAYRDANGPFSSARDLMKVSGIKEGVYEKLKDRITVK